MEKVQEPAVVYGTSSYYGKKGNALGISEGIMDELLGQSDEVKLMVISRLAESMRKETAIREENLGLEEWKNAMAVKRKELQRKYNLPDDLARLVGCLPPRSDKEREEAKEAYLREKGVSYVIAGSKELDCRIAMEKLYSLFHIKK